MRKTGTLVLSAILAAAGLMFLISDAAAYVLDRTVTVTAQASVTGSTSLSRTIRNRSNDSTATTMTFPTITGGVSGKLSNQYVDITLYSNYEWELEIYTNNYTFDPDPNVYGYQYGGLKHTTTDRYRTPLVWKAFCNKPASITDPPAAPDTDKWVYIKDKRDKNIPGTKDPQGNPIDESWQAAHNGGYTNIAYGGPDWINVVEPGTNGIKKDSPYPFYLYIAGSFGSSYQGSYSTTIGIDLYHP